MNYPQPVQDNIFDRMNSPTFPRGNYPMSNIPVCPANISSQLVENALMNKSQLQSHQYPVNNLSAIGQRITMESGRVDYDVKNEDKLPLIVDVPPAAKPLPTFDRIPRHAQATSQGNTENPGKRLTSKQKKMLLTESYMDALAEIQNSDEDLYEAFSNIPILDRGGQQVTTEDLLKLDVKKNDSDSLRLDVSVVDIEEIRELRKKYFLGERKAKAEENELKTHTNGILETMSNPNTIFKKPDPPQLANTSKVNNCQAVVPPLNATSTRKVKVTPSSTITSRSLPVRDISEGDYEVDGAIEFDHEGDYTDIISGMLIYLNTSLWVCLPYAIFVFFPIFWTFSTICLLLTYCPSCWKKPKKLYISQNSFCQPRPMFTVVI